MKHVVSFGGGASSALLALHAWHYYGKDASFVMAVLPNEHPDVWRTCDRIEEITGVQFEYIAATDDIKSWRYVVPKDRDNYAKLLTPFDVFFKVSFIGNSRIDPCSLHLKREVMRHYMLDTYPDKNAVLYVGIGPDEWDRMARIVPAWADIGYAVEAPLSTQRELTKDVMIQQASFVLGFTPENYLLNFSHNNCGGACVKGGHREWARLLYYRPDVYAEWELAENIFRARVGDYAILRDRTGGQSRPLTLYEFRRRMEREFAGVLPGMIEHVVFKQLPSMPACFVCAAA